MALDDLFREALRPMANATPPKASWQRVVHAVARSAGEAGTPARLEKVWAWIRSFQVAARYPSDGLVCLQPYGLAGLSPWAMMLAR